MAMDQASPTLAAAATSSFADACMSSFIQTYVSCPISYIEKPHLEDGNRIIMPASALDRLTSLQIEYPMIFSIQNPSTDKVSHCGVLEFGAPEGLVYLPDWMMKNMGLEEGQLINFKDTALPKGVYMKIQPHTMSFLINLTDPKAFLESKLRDFSCVTPGDTIMIRHNEEKYYINIIETKPINGAISLVDTDCEVDFVPPLDYKELEEKLNKVPVKDSEPELKPAKGEEEATKPTFKPFTGVAKRLDGSSSLVRAECSVVAEPRKAIGKRPGKLVFGGDGTTTSTQAHANSQMVSKESASVNNEKKFQSFTGKSHRLGG
ncbi:hypothetical protein LguiA_024687 [Lonicera macranthoides]